MKFSLINLIVWPRDASKAPRVLTFAETGINLITGSSRSGKSAIIKIIDYCLGSTTCNIPKLGPIRRSSEWYGVVIQTEEGYKLLARRDPDTQESTDDYMLVESALPTFPDRPIKNANRAAIEGLLSRLARLPQANADFYGSGSGYKSRASFGDMTSFMFQPQWIVANETVLFYETEDEDHARKLREIFPLVLGAVDADTLIKQHRLAEVRQLLERRRRQLEALRGSIEDYAGEVRGRYLNAIDLGLLQGDVASIDLAETRVLLERLRDLVRGWVGGRRPEDDARSFGAAARLAELRQRESFLAQQIASLRLRQVQLRELSQARQISEGLLARERDRLAPTSWLVEDVANASSCPFCGSENHTGTLELARLGERAAAVESQWQGLATIPPMLDAEEVEIRRAQEQEENQLRQTRAEKAHLDQLTEMAAKPDEERALFIGKLIEFLTLQRSLTDDVGLPKEIEDLETEESELRVQVDSDLIAQRKEDALLLISKYAQHYGRIVELENNESLIKLDTKELTIRVLDDKGESAWLSQIGSGANHLGYHVATLLALHEFFITKPIPYVPSLLILDQPSQTQFPDDIDEEAEQEEMIAVHKAFEALDEAIGRTRGKLQVIVSEHAGKTVYEGLEHLTVIERWRRGRKLIPWHWDAEALQALNGLSAEAAVEDLLKANLVPALAKAFGLSGTSEIADVKIDHANFVDLSVTFQVTVSITQPEGTRILEEESQPSARLVRRTANGSIQKGLSISIDRIQSSDT
jgi:hypothetical protein